MKSYGHVDFQGNEVQNALLKLSSEVNFPTIPTVGQLLFKDRIVYVCLEITSGVPSWVPLTSAISSYLFIQDTASSVWNITHNLYTMFPLVQIYGIDNKMVIPDTLEVTSNTTVRASFGTPITGRATIMIGNTDGSTRQNIAFEFNQTTLSDTWVIDHHLGYFPVIRIFIGNAEVQPLTIVHDNINQATITFSSPQIGVARCV